jgi:hypothetical protein
MDRADGGGCMNSHRQFDLLCVERTRRDRRIINKIFWVVDPGQVTFFCAAKRKSPKKRPPRMTHPNPCAPRLWDPRWPDATSCRAVQSHASMHATPSGRNPKALRCSGLRHTGTQNPNRSCCDGVLFPGTAKWVFFCVGSPYGAPEHRKPLPASPKGRAQDERVSCAATGMSRRMTVRQRRGAQDKRAIRGVLSFGDFSLHEQRKVTCPGSTTQKFCYQTRRSRAARSAQRW